MQSRRDYGNLLKNFPSRVCPHQAHVSSGGASLSKGCLMEVTSVIVEHSSPCLIPPPSPKTPQRLARKLKHRPSRLPMQRQRQYRTQHKPSEMASTETYFEVCIYSPECVPCTCIGRLFFSHRQHRASASSLPK